MVVDDVTSREPQTPAVESREETVDRVMTEQRKLGVPEATTDPTSRRRLGRSMVVVGHLAGLAAAAAVIAIVLGVWDNLAFALALGAAGGLVVGVITALLLAEREDGRIEDEVDHRSEHATTDHGTI